MPRNIVLDIEADDLLVEASKLWCISARDLDSDAEWFDDIVNGKYEIPLNIGDTIIGHNITGYDLHILNRLLPISEPLYTLENFKYIDTALLSRMLNPLWKGKGVHSLKEWGKRLGTYKGEYNDFKTPCQEMYDYCRGDTAVTKILARNLIDKAKTYGDKFLNEAIPTYTTYAYLLGKQQEKGVVFDREKAEQLYTELQEEAVSLSTRISSEMPKIRKNDHYKKCKKEGRIEEESEVGYSYTSGKNNKITYKEFKFEEPNPNSQQQVVKLLLSLGWKPSKFSDKTGLAKLDKDIIDFIDIPIAKDISTLRKLNKKMGFIKDGDKSWLKCVNKHTGRIHGSIIVNGAKSGRCTAGSPNTQQIPKAKIDPRLRSLWIAEPGKLLVASDASQLELRIQAHYLHAYDNGAYAHLIQTVPDIHEYNRELMGLNDRGNAKGIKYGYDYGAGDTKLGLLYSFDQHLGEYDENKLKSYGKLIRNKLEEITTGLRYFKSDLEQAYRGKGFIKSLLGRPLFLDMVKDRNGRSVPKLHAVLNLLIQGGAADIMARTCEVFYKDMTRQGLKLNVEYDFVLNIHDEIVIECHEHVKDIVAKGLEKAWTAAGESMGLKCPIVGDTKIGHNLLEVK